jgi:hypothetical protein
MPLNLGLICWGRRGAPERQGAHPVAAALVLEAGGLAARGVRTAIVAGLLLVALIAPPTAGAAGPGPDPAPPPAATGHATQPPQAPSPDPAPGARAAPVSGPRTAGPPGPVAPRPPAMVGTSSRAALAATDAAPARTPKHPSRVRWTSRGASPRNPANPAVGALGPMVARKLGQLGFPLHVSITPTAIRPDGTLLLMAAVASAVLAVASLSLLRLLVRLRSEWDEGPA